MFRDAFSLSALSVAGVSISSWRMSTEWSKLATQHWAPYQRLYVAVLAVIYFLSIFGVFCTTRKS